jgi:biotin transport system permease protein
MIPIYVDGATPAHRLPAGVKLAALFVVVTAVSVTPNGPLLAGWTVLVILGYGVSRLLRSQLVRQILVARWIIVITLVGQILFVAELTAVLNTLRVLILILMAALFTLTTRVSDVLDTIERMLGPFRRFGVNPEGVGLVLMIALSSASVVASLSQRVRDAHFARRARPSLIHMVTTMPVLAFKHADELGDALVARGGDQQGARR